MSENRSTKNNNSKKTENCRSKKSEACRSESKSSDDDKESKPRRLSPPRKSSAPKKSATDVNAKNGYNEEIPQENVIFPDVVPNTTYTNRVTPLMSVPNANGGAATAAKRKDREGIGAGGVVALLLIAAFIIFIIVVTAGGSASTAQAGSITGNTNVGYGKTSVLTYDIGDATIMPYDQVVWYVGDREVQRKLYSEDGALTYELDGDTLGYQRIRVVAGGRVFCECDAYVSKPSLDVNVDNAISIYGDEIAAQNYKVEGFSESDSASNYPEGKVYYTAYGEETETTPKSVGIYKARLNHGFVNDAYDVNVNEGTLEIVPRELVVVGNVVKDYDGSSVVENPKLKLLGVMNGDDVSVVCDKLYLSDKNAGGDKQYSLYNMTLTGKDAANYKIGSSDLNVMIMPKQITVDELRADDKVYDGTNAATFTNYGNLNGVINGDIVQIGAVEGYYSDTKVGKNVNVTVNKVNLVGSDSGNYTVQNPTAYGSINRFAAKPTQETTQEQTTEQK